MIDIFDTTVAWESHDTSIAILPVGAVEQHGAHLPLKTDCIIADHFAHVLGEQLDAAVMPLMPVATSLEHAGFRGSFTLKPETAMAVIRDLVDEAEKQRFNRLIVVNGHGGNFFLTPVIRDINRADRPIKLILANPFDFGPPHSGHGKLDLHAGRWETSLMLAIAPQHVGDDRRDRPDPTGGKAHLKQSDLNTFGMAHFAPDGPVGYPSQATAEFGQQIVDEISANMLTYVEQRLKLLDDNPTYGRANHA